MHQELAQLDEHGRPLGVVNVKRAQNSSRWEYARHLLLAPNATYKERRFGAPAI